MSVISNWKITWDPGGTPLVLLDHGQEMEGELDLPWEQEHVDRQVIEGTYTEPLPRSWVKGGLVFTAWKEHADDLTARAYILSHRLTTIHGLRGLRKTLRITPLGGGNTDLANTIIKSAPGRMVIVDHVAMTAFTYTLLGPW